MDEWATSLLGYLYNWTDRPLRWGTSCCSATYFFSDPALSCLPESGFPYKALSNRTTGLLNFQYRTSEPALVASSAQFFSSHSCYCYTAFSNLQLQSRKAQESHYGQEVPSCSCYTLLQCVLQSPAAIRLARSVAVSLMLCCTQPCQWVVSQPVANPHGRSVAPNRPIFRQCQQCGLFRTTPNMVFFHMFFLRNRELATLWYTFWGKSFFHRYATNDHYHHYPILPFEFLYDITLSHIFSTFFSMSMFHISPTMTRAYDIVWKLPRCSHDVYDPLHRPRGCLSVLPAASVLSRGAHQWLQGPEVGKLLVDD